LFQPGAEVQRFAWQEDADLTTQNSQLGCSAISQVKFILRLPPVRGNDERDFSNTVIRSEFGDSVVTGILTGKLTKTARRETHAKEAAGIFSQANGGLASFLLVPQVKRAKAQHEWLLSAIFEIRER
jgi:hypothetical protein